MSAARVMALVARDVAACPRSSAFLYALVMPILMSFLIQVVLVTLFDPAPRLGIADLGDSRLAASLSALDGIEVTRVDGEGALRALVADHDVDVGLVLPAGFDRALRAGERPLLDLSVSGESRMVNRILLAVTAVDEVRQIEGRPAPVEVVQTTVGDRPPLPIQQLAVLGIVLWALVVTGTLVTGSMVAQEKEQGTLQALLVSPATLTEVLIAKGALGLALCVGICLLTLGLNGALSSRPLELLATLGVAALLCVEIGLIYGVLAGSTKAVYNLAQSLNFLVLAPIFFYFLPRWPQWPAKLFPTYWFIDPLYRVALRGARLADVWVDLGIALGVGALLALAVVGLARRMRGRLALG